MTTDNMDAAYLLQVQLQLHATGADVGYLFSWSRTNITVHSVRYRHSLITAVAQVVKHIIEQFINPQTVPAFPSDASKFQGELRTAWLLLHKEMAALMATCELEQLREGMWVQHDNR